ncbi:hypothetical protein [Salibacterium salarium]|nr:hypothetical protein [Salibacterium salarium]
MWILSITTDNKEGFLIKTTHSFLIFFSTILCLTTGCQPDRSPDADVNNLEPQSRLLDPTETGWSPSDYNQGPGNESMTTNNQNQGTDNAKVKSVAEDAGFSPLYVTFGGRHAYIYANANDSWSKKEKKQKTEKLQQQYKREFPKYQVRVHVLND